MVCSTNGSLYYFFAIQEVSGGSPHGSGEVNYVAIVKLLPNTVSPDEMALKLGQVSAAVATAMSPSARREFCFVSADLQVLSNLYV